MTLILVGLSVLLTLAFMLLDDLRALGSAIVVALLARLSQASDHHKDRMPPK